MHRKIDKMRKIFIEELLKLMKKDKTVLFLVADIGWQFKVIKEKFPKRYIDTGINEQALIGIAAGLAHEGYKPFVYGITCFLLERALEFVKLDIVANQENVKIIGFGDYPNSGITHQCPYDTKICDLIKLSWFVPMDKNSLIICIKKMYESKKPWFLKLKRLK